jgi:hypothetical protein
MPSKSVMTAKAAATMKTNCPKVMMLTPIGAGELT